MDRMRDCRGISLYEGMTIMEGFGWSILVCHAVILLREPSECRNVRFSFFLGVRGGVGREFRFTERKGLRGCDEVQRIIIWIIFFSSNFFRIGRHRQLVRYDTLAKATWPPIHKRERNREKSRERRGEERRGEGRRGKKCHISGFPKP